MPRSVYIQIPKACRRIGLGFRLFLALALVLPIREAHAISSEGLVQMASVQGVLIAIANLNRAMRSAAESPMDDWRRADVKRAIDALPPAIIALAKDFQAGKLHDQDFPMVQQMLGGFVDVNAADNYKKFLQRPSADLIPQVGANFPQQYLGPGNGPPGRPSDGGSRVAFDDNQAKRPPGTIKDTFVSQADSDPSKSLKAAAIKEVNEKEEKAADSLRISFDDSVRKGGLEGNYASDKGAPGTEPGEGGGEGSTMDRLQAALSGSPAGGSGGGSPSFLTRAGAGGLGGITVIRRDSASEMESDALDEDFFDRTDPRKAPKKGKPHTDYRLPVKPKYWAVSPYLKVVERLLIAEARAEGGGCGGDCGGGGGEGGGGGQAAQILFGIAAIISAISPMVVASIQANADKEIARTNAQAQITMTQITADTSKFLSNQQTKVALEQTAAAERINRENQDRVSERLELQLAELRSAREDAAQRERERLAEEKRLNQERIALAQKQAEDNLKLARQTLNAQLTQAGLQSGFSNTQNSSNRLTVTALNTTNRTTGSQLASGTAASGGTSQGGTDSPSTGQAFLSRDSSQTVAEQLGTNGNQAQPTTGLGALLAANNPTRGVPDGRGTVAETTISQRLAKLDEPVSAESGRSRLLSSLGTPRGVNGEPMVYDAQSGMFVPKVAMNQQPKNGAQRAVAAGPRANNGREGRGLATVLGGPSHRAIRGSTAKDPVRITGVTDATRVASVGGADAERSDLGEFLNDGDSFARFRANERARAAVPEPTAHSGRGAAGGEPTATEAISRIRNAYNPPVPAGGGHSGGGGGRGANYSTAIAN